MYDYWIKQTADKPAFPDMLWSRPENKQLAGKLLVIGGNVQGFAAPAEAYRYAEKAGVGVVRMLLPESVRRFVGPVFDAGDFAPTTLSGSFSRQALSVMLDMASWADAVLLAGNVGHNSETAIVIESFLGKYHGPLTLVGDSMDSVMASPQTIADRPDTLLVPTFAQLQRLAAAVHMPRPFTSSLDLLHFTQALCELTTAHQLHVVTLYNGHSLAAAAGRVSSTAVDDTPPELQLATGATVWWLQNPSRVFEALTTGLLER